MISVNLKKSDYLDGLIQAEREAIKDFKSDLSDLLNKYKASLHLSEDGIETFMGIEIQDGKGEIFTHDFNFVIGTWVDVESLDRP